MNWWLDISGYTVDGCTEVMHRLTGRITFFWCDWEWVD